ncbi:hypothetical protein [Pseudomarimonas salicorniae]|uniref:Secreted protein n=1 Tax=Pseudomarimonas salicorniae TaxID=2933270 RepID=A0ABT0GM47_9GAMM|nr:hypothetical protein [Lysobacter sp. CAU 1642]MCK7595585.1 hypothetical protein [Lysobacter sp. CAU 1642]
MPALRYPILLALLLGAANASAASRHKDVTFSPAGFSEQRGRLIESLNGKLYHEIGDEAKQEVLDALDRMSARLSGVSSIDQLSEPDKVAVFNDQELINTLLSDAAADSRLVCTREKTLGSNMRSNTCLTVAERRRRQEQSQEQMRRLQRPSALPAGN